MLENLNVNLIVNNIELKDINVKELEISSRFNGCTKLLGIFQVPKKLSENFETLFDKEESIISIKVGDNNIFKGFVNEIIIQYNKYEKVFVRIESEDMTMQLRKEIKNRVFQDTNFKYSDLVNEIMKDYDVEYTISDEYATNISQLYYQCDETDWDFLVRISNDINSIITVTKEGVIVFGYQKVNTVIEVK